MANPLPPCPNSPNCCRTSRTFSVAPEIVLGVAEKAVRAHRGLFSGAAESVSVNASGIEAVFRIGPFKDDLSVAFESLADGTTALHMRSKSRRGHFDYGVNRRRIRAVLKVISTELG